MSGPRDYSANLSRSAEQLEEESRQHGGQFVARSPDGLKVVAYAPSRRDLITLLVARDIDLSEIVIAHVPDPDATYVS